jgi:hypothetical protein
MSKFEKRNGKLPYAGSFCHGRRRDVFHRNEPGAATGNKCRRTGVEAARFRHARRSISSAGKIPGHALKVSQQPHVR